MKNVYTGFLFIDPDPRECDFCDNKKECASIDTLLGVIIVCKDCLKEFIEEFDEENEK